MKRSALFLLAWIPLFVLSGCSVLVQAYTDPLGRRSELQLVQREYSKYIRWGDVEAAAKFVHPDLQQEFMELEADFKLLRVSDFDIGAIEYGEGLDTATVRVVYHAYSIRTLIEREIKEEQLWERLGGNHWVVRPKLEGLVNLAAAAHR